MASGRSIDSDPFADPISMQDERATIVESTLSVGRNATLTLGTDAVIVLGTVSPRPFHATPMLISSPMQTKVFTTLPPDNSHVAGLSQRVSIALQSLLLRSFSLTPS